MTLLQTLLILSISAGVSAVVFQSLATLYEGQMVASSIADNSANARMAVDTMIDHVRSTDACSDSTKGVQYSGLDSATATSFVYYTDPTSCATVKYYLSGTSLYRADPPTTNSPVIEARNISSLAFTYTYLDTSTGNYATTQTPTAAQLPFVYAIRVDITTTSNGVSSQLSSTVRLRNATYGG